MAEMLVVLAILGTVVAALAPLFTSALGSQKDQTNRSKAQQDARVALDRLRREIHCAGGLTPTSGYPRSAITISLGSYCPATGGATTVTWCTKDKNGAAPNRHDFTIALGRALKEKEARERTVDELALAGADTLRVV